jgi:ankyrin repeat protein
MIYRAIDSKRMNALHLASLHGHLPIVRLLVSHKYKTKDACNNGMTALHYAVAHDHVEITK